ncbi:hypothetical protein MBANPS3_012424 [Mucor bainieri]
MSEHDVAALIQRLAQLEAAVQQQQQQQSSPATDPYLTTRLAAQDLTPYPEFYNVLPGAQDDFFRSPLSEKERRAFLHACPTNTDRQYQPPTLQTTSVGAFTKRHDEQLTTIQYRLSGLTRPLDLMAHNLAQQRPLNSHDATSFLRTMHSLISDVASHITQLRIDNVCKDTGLSSVPLRPDTSSTPLLDTDAILERTKLEKSLRDAQSKKRPSQKKKGKRTNQHGNTGSNNDASRGQQGDTNERPSQPSQSNTRAPQPYKSTSSSSSKDNRQPMDPQHHQRGISHPFHTPTTGTAHTVSPLSSCHISGGSIRHRPGDTRPIGQESDRSNPWSWFRFTPLHHPQENRRPSARAEPQTAQSVHPPPVLQDGNNPTVPVERSDPPIQVSRLWPVSQPTGVYQGTPSGSTLGSTQRNPYLSVFRRFDHRREDQGTDRKPHHSGPQQVGRVGIPLQCNEISPHSYSATGSSGVPHRHDHHVSLGAQSEGARSPTRSTTVDEDTNMQSAPPVLIHRQSSSNNTGGLSSPVAHATASPTEESSPSPGSDMDIPSDVNAACPRQSAVVDHPPTTMERPLFHTRDTHAGSLYGRLRSGLGDHLQRSSPTGQVDHSGTTTPHQLPGVAGDLEADSGASVAGSSPPSLLRQRVSHCLCAQLRRYTLSCPHGARNHDLELVPQDQDTPTHDLHPQQDQPGGRPLTPAVNSNRMEDPPLIVPTTGPTLGPSRLGLLCERPQPPNTDLHLMDLGPARLGDERLLSPMELVEPRVPVSPVELDPTLPAAPASVPHRGDHHHTELDERHLVPSDSLNDTGASSPTPIEVDLPRTTRGRSPREELDLGALSLEHKRQRLTEQGYDSHALAVFFNPEVRPSRTQYTATQQRFIQWCNTRGENPWTPTPSLIVNYLAYGYHTLQWKVNTCMAYQSAILQLYSTDLRPILQQDPGYQEFLNSLKALTVKTFDKPRFNLEPALLHIRSLGDNTTMSTEHLTQKLCFLLAITGFLRNADIHRINVAKVQLQNDNTKLHLVIDCPKEKRKGSPIERVTVIQQHPDPSLCPIRTYVAYTQRIATTPCVGPHPTRPSRQLDFLIRSLHDFKVAVGPQTIGRHVRSILALVEVDNRAHSSSRPLRARAVGSTNSVLHGASVDDILAHGSWSSSSIFDNFYRLSRETLTNFTHMSLSSTVHSQENSGSTVRVDDS